MEIIKQVERLALHAWPGLEINEVDGWLLRYAAGITRRANSVWPNDARAEYTLEDDVVRVEKFYHARGLPARFQICPAAQPAGLDEFLAQRGYRAVARTAVQNASLAGMLGQLRRSMERASPLSVEVTRQPLPIWWECYTKADEVSPESVTARKQICARVEQETAYVVVWYEGEAVAVGSAVAEAGWVGFFNVATVPTHRRIGAAQAVMLALGKWGETVGAREAYLQVMADNLPAWNLYARLGFVTQYYYHYREQVLGTSDDSGV